MPGGKRYYIGGKQYRPDESATLCSYKDPIGGAVTLYRTEKGAFFTVRDNILTGETEIEVISEGAARALMDAHPAGIDPDNYDRAFGEPERG